MKPDHFRSVEPKPDPVCDNCVYNHYKAKWAGIGCIKHDFSFRVCCSREMAFYTCDDFKAEEEHNEKTN